MFHIKKGSFLILHEHNMHLISTSHILTFYTWWRGDDDELAPPPAAVELGGDATLRGDLPPPAVVTGTVVLEGKWVK